MNPNPINEYSTASDTLAPGRFNLAGQQKPDYLIDLAAARDDAEARAWKSAGDFNQHMTDKTLAALLEDELAAQDAEAAYLAALSDWHNGAQWGAENAIEQVLEHFTEA